LNVKLASLALVPIFYVDPLAASIVALTTCKIVRRTSAGKRGQAAMIAAKSGSTSGESVPDSVPRELETADFAGKFEIVRGLSGPLK
jgi:hypothetical protein